MRRSLFSLGFVTGCAALAAFAQPSLAQPSQAEPIGRISAVKLGAYGTLPDGPRAPAYPHDRVIQNQTLETVSRGGLTARLADGTDLTMGSDAKLVIDALIYDPAAPMGATNPAMTLVAGAFRLASTTPEGTTSQPVGIPFGTIGVRGTVWSAVIDPVTQQTTLKTVQGLISVTSTVTNDSVDVPAGFSLTVSGDGLGSVTAMASQDAGFTGDPGVDSVASGLGLEGNDHAGDSGESHGSSGGDH